MFLKKAIFAVHTLDMTISSSLQYSLKYAASNPAWKKIYLKIFFGRKHPIYAFYEKNFPSDILKNGLFLTPKGHLGSN